MHPILHITKRSQWETAKLLGVYRSDTLDSEGFIHCSTPQQVIATTKRYFARQQRLVLLYIAPEKVQAEIRYEGISEEKFPHIYGPVNLDAITLVINWEPNENGEYELVLDGK